MNKILLPVIFNFCKKNKTFFQKGLDKRKQMRYNIKVRKNAYVPLAQPDRVFGYEPKGRGFESLKARQTKSGYPIGYPLFVSRSFITQNPANFRLRKFVITCASCLWYLSALYARLGSESLNEMISNGYHPFLFLVLLAENPRQITCDLP